jgi:hypothetical protein
MIMPRFIVKAKITAGGYYSVKAISLADAQRNVEHQLRTKPFENGKISFIVIEVNSKSKKISFWR